MTASVSVQHQECFQSAVRKVLSSNIKLTTLAGPLYRSSVAAECQLSNDKSVRWRGPSPPTGGQSSGLENPVLRCAIQEEKAISVSSNRITAPASSRRQSYAPQINVFVEKQGFFEDEHVYIDQNKWSHLGT
ncbi:MAG TPA: hypothetical protein VGU19_04705 [Microvirga sp.]|jgi:hypothetical protein|nr:hypothetical protein [Microvirga sp.]